MRPARTTGTSCRVTGLVPGTTYTFTVVADNAHQGWMGTGDGAGAEFSTLVPTRSGAPESLRVRPGDRTLQDQLGPPVNQGGTSVSAYDVSINGGQNWRRVRTVLANGRLSTRVVAVRNGASYNGQGAGAQCGRERLEQRAGEHSDHAVVPRPAERGDAKPAGRGAQSSEQLPGPAAAHQGDGARPRRHSCDSGIEPPCPEAPVGTGRDRPLRTTVQRTTALSSRPGDEPRSSPWCGA